jgi:pSer/pThr/pTyr-binding forkhead associated (FHA) protein
MAAVLHPTGTGHQISIDRAVVLIGRSPECDAVIDFSSKISRVHCAVVQVDAEYFIRDLGSLNGVWVGGVRVDKDTKLAHGAAVAIGDVKFQFLDNIRTSKPGRLPAEDPAIVEFADEEIEVLDVDEVEVIDPDGSTRPPSRQALQSTIQHKPTPDVNRQRRQMPEIVEDVEVVEDDEYVEDVEVVEELEDVEVIEDVEIIPDEPRRSRAPKRLR